MKRKEWIEMVNQELDELQRMSDRKADKKSIQRFSIDRKKRTKTVKFQIAKTKLTDLYRATFSSEFLNYNFGIDLKEDFSNLFSIFNRVAKAKLDHMVLSEFASKQYVDSLFQRTSSNFSTQLKTYTELYFSQIDNRLNEFERKFAIFKANVDFYLTKLEDRIYYCKTQISKMKAKHQIELKTTSQMGKKKDLTTPSELKNVTKESRSAYKEANKLIQTAFLLKSPSSQSFSNSQLIEIK